MRSPAFPDLDLTPPSFGEGLHDWSRQDGSPESRTYGDAIDARIITGDPDFGQCLELVKTETRQRLRYMGELPVRPGHFIEASVRLKVLQGPMPTARMAATPGGAGGHILSGLPETGPEVEPAVLNAPMEYRVTIGPAADRRVDLVWGPEALYAHVGLDLTGPKGGLIRIENMCVRDVTSIIAPDGPVLQGFVRASLD